MYERAQCQQMPNLGTRKVPKEMKRLAGTNKSWSVSISLYHIILL